MIMKESYLPFVLCSSTKTYFPAVCIFMDINVLRIRNTSDVFITLTVKGIITYIHSWREISCDSVCMEMLGNWWKRLIDPFWFLFCQRVKRFFSNIRPCTSSSIKVYDHKQNQIYFKQYLEKLCCCKEIKYLLTFLSQ